MHVIVVVVVVICCEHRSGGGSVCGRCGADCRCGGGSRLVLAQTTRVQAAGGLIIVVEHVCDGEISLKSAYVCVCVSNLSGRKERARKLLKRVDLV